MERDVWERYGDIISMPHHISKKRPRMAMEERGAQFSPFAALTGYGEAIKETARLTEVRPELTEAAKAELNTALNLAMESGCAVSVTCFEADERKQGGKLVTVSGRIRQADSCRGVILMEDGLVLPAEDILRIEPIGQ